MPPSRKRSLPKSFLRLPGSEPRKVAVARFIGEKTTVPQSWIAEKLVMGSPANVSQQLRRSDLPKDRRTLQRDLVREVANYYDTYIYLRQ
jgi:hypothetical protein